MNKYQRVGSAVLVGGVIGVLIALWLPGEQWRLAIIAAVIAGLGFGLVIGGVLAEMRDDL